MLTPDEDDDNKYVYRAMQMDADEKPNVAAPGEAISSKHLGARERDFELNEWGKTIRDGDGNVSPGKQRGGMSTATILPGATKPVFVGFIEDKLNPDITKKPWVIFRIKVSELESRGLVVDFDKPGHASVQPNMTMTEVQYQQNIRETRSLWKVWTP